MSWQPALDPKPGDAFACDAIDMIIVPRARDLGGFSVRRALPSRQRQMVGPFIFFDQMGPAEFLLGAGMDVRPHPHIASHSFSPGGQLKYRISLTAAINRGIQTASLNTLSLGTFCLAYFSLRAPEAQERAPVCTDPQALSQSPDCCDGITRGILSGTQRPTA